MLRTGILALLFLGLTVMLGPSADAATVTAVNRQHCHLLLEGPIEPGDLDKLKRARKEYEDGWQSRPSTSTQEFVRELREQYGLCLAGPGGSYSEALAIAQYLLSAEGSIGTFVDRDETCLSACAIIWLAGSQLYESQINPRRAVHVEARLGFHAPYLDGAPAGTFTGEAVVNAYQAGLSAIGKLAALPYSQQESRHSTDGARDTGYFYLGELVPKRLLVEMLRHGPNEMFLIDTPIKALLLHIDLQGYAPPHSLGQQAMCNACYNNNMLVFERAFTGSAQCSGGRIERTPQGHRGYFKGFGGEATFTCIVDIRQADGRPDELRLEFLSTGSEDRFRPDELTPRPLWLLHFADDRPLRDLARPPAAVHGSAPVVPRPETNMVPGLISQPAGPSLWDHNGSIMRLEADGASRRFYYEAPREGMRKMGVKPGTLLFDGERSGETYSGTSRIFRGSCGAFPYAVAGEVASDQRRVVMRGRAPRVDGSCQIVGYRDDELVFELMGK